MIINKGGFMSKKVTFGEMDKIIAKKIKNIEGIDRDMQYIARDMQNKIDMRFKQTKDPNGKPWPELSDATKARRRGRSSKPLNDRGGLKNSVSSSFGKTSTGGYAIAGANAVYARYQNNPVEKGELGTKRSVNVKPHKRNSYRRTSGSGETTTVKRHNVRGHSRRGTPTPWGDKPGRSFIGFSKNQITEYNRLLKNRIKK